MGFSFNNNKKIVSFGDVYIAEFDSNAPITTGSKALLVHRISRIDMDTGEVYDFANILPSYLDQFR